MKDKNILLSYQTKRSQESNKLAVAFYDYDQHRAADYYLQHTKHSNIRSQQRGITDEMICIATDLGDCVHKQGLAFYTISESNRKKVEDKQFAGKLKNLVIVMDDATGTVITVYKNKNGVKNIARKNVFLS